MLTSGARGLRVGCDRPDISALLSDAYSVLSPVSCCHQSWRFICCYQNKHLVEARKWRLGLIHHSRRSKRVPNRGGKKRIWYIAISMSLYQPQGYSSSTFSTYSSFQYIFCWMTPINIRHILYNPINLQLQVLVPKAGGRIVSPGKKEHMHLSFRAKAFLCFTTISPVCFPLPTAVLLVRWDQRP